MSEIVAKGKLKIFMSDAATSTIGDLNISDILARLVHGKDFHLLSQVDRDDLLSRQWAVVKDSDVEIRIFENEEDRWRVSNV